MIVVAEPIDEEEVERRQTGNKRDLADFLEALDKQMKGGEGAVPSFKGPGDQGKEEEADDDEEVEESESGEDDDESDVEDAKDIGRNRDVERSIEKDAVKALKGNPEADTEAIGLARAGNKKEVEEPEKFPEMYVQVMYIKNYVNEKLVPRPTRLGKDDKWKVAVTIDELPPKPAYMINIGVVKRRKRVIEHRMVTEDDAEAGAYIRQLRNMSRAGRDWAKAQEKIFPGEPVLYKPGPG